MSKMMYSLFEDERLNIVKSGYSFHSSFGVWRSIKLVCG